MSNKIEDGGAAFPMGFHPEGNSADQIGGLSIRDYFAAQIVGPLMASDSFEAAIMSAKWINPEALPNFAAKTAYEIADAMLAERAKERKST